MVLVDVYRALYKARGHRGALDFDAAEAEFVIDASERVRAIELRVRNDAHRLIEECMILANVAVAEALEKAHVPTLYRVARPAGGREARAPSRQPLKHSASMRAYPRP